MNYLRLQQAYRGGDSRGRPGWWLHIDYDEAGVEILKRAIPSHMRTWDDEHKRWWVHEQEERKLLEIIPSLEAFTKQGALF